MYGNAICILVGIFSLFMFGYCDNLTIVTDVQSGISYVIVENTDSGVYCTADNVPIQLRDTCEEVQPQASLTQSYKVNGHAWSSLNIRHSRLPEFIDLSTDNISISIYNFSSSKVLIELNAEILFMYPNQKPLLTWHHLDIIRNRNKICLLNQCRDLNNNINIKSISVQSEGAEEIFWKLELDVIRKITRAGQQLIDIKQNTDKKIIKVYKYQGQNINLYTNYNLVKYDNWYEMKLGRYDNILHGTSVGEIGVIGSVYLCQFERKRVYTLAFDKDKKISCGLEDQSQKVTIKKVKSNILHESFAYNTPISGSYICNSSICYCKIGFRGDYCEEADNMGLKCFNNNWGNNCEKTCGHCFENTICDRITGRCQMCEVGYFGNDCSGKVEFSYSIYSKNLTHFWMRWKINQNVDRIFFKTGESFVADSTECNLWTNYLDYRCSILGFKVKAEFEVIFKDGIRNWSVYNITETLKSNEDVSEPPLNLSNDETKIFWQHPNKTNGHLNFFIIHVRLIESGFNINDSCDIHVRVGLEQKLYEINYQFKSDIKMCYDDKNTIYLKPGSKYNVSVTPYNSIKGLSSKPITISTDLIRPSIENSICNCNNYITISNWTKDGAAYLIAINMEENNSNLMDVFKFRSQSGFNDKLTILNRTANSVFIECDPQSNYFYLIVMNRYNNYETYIMQRVGERSTKFTIDIWLILFIILCLLILTNIIYFSVRIYKSSKCRKKADDRYYHAVAIDDIKMNAHIMRILARGGTDEDGYEIVPPGTRK